MSVEQPLIIDRIAKRPSGQALSLVITDHLQWGDSDDTHEELLLHKLGNYVAFVESGRVLEEYPEAQDWPVWVEVVAEHPLSDRAQSFFLSARDALAEKGLRFDVRGIDLEGRLSGTMLPNV